MADRVVDFLFGVVSGGFDLFCPSLSRIRFREYVKDIFPYFILALASAILSCGVYLLLPSDLWRLCLVPVVYVVLYLGGAYMLKLEMLQEMLSMLKSRVKRGGEA